MSKMTTQQFVDHLTALLEYAHSDSGPSIEEIKVSRFTPSIVDGRHYLGVTFPHSDSEFFVQIDVA